MRARSKETSSAPGSGVPVATKLLRIAEKARREPDFRFTSLYHLMNKELLLSCFSKLRKDAAAGIDKMTKEQYAEDMEGNLSNLIDRLHTMAYIPQPVRRQYIPKPGSAKRRPLGIPCFEDKLVQAGLVRILESVYEQDFIEHSYGFRPGRGCHDALRSLSDAVENNPTNHIVEADIKGFFDSVDQQWLLKFVSHRIGDPRILRMVKRFLKAGVYEDGSVEYSDEGTPQGGVISPLLANIYLHYALDLWFERVFRASCRGFARLIRYADDFVVCFQYKTDAQRFHQELAVRLGRFMLALEPSKTKIMEFGRFAVQHGKQKGKKAGTFDFLGFTHYCGTRRDGSGFRMKRVTARKKFVVKLKMFKEWLKRARILKTRELWKLVAAKLRGHYNYYGVTDNTPGITRFYKAVTKLLFKWLNRRGKRRCLNWTRFTEMLARYPLPKPRITVSMFGFCVN